MSGVDTGMINRASQLQARFSSLTPAPNVFRIAGDGSGDNASFPVQLGSTDPDDKKYNLRSKLVGDDGVVKNVGIAVTDDKFYDYAKRKEDQAVLYDFYRFMFNQADLTKPESANWWFSKFPWMRDMRLEEINKQADLQKTLARIQVTGPESEDDFMLLFLIRNGTIVPPTGSLWQMGITGNGPTVATSFKQGFFSKLVTGSFWDGSSTGGVFTSPPGAFGGNSTANMGVIWDKPVPTEPRGGPGGAFTNFNQAYKAPAAGPTMAGIPNFRTLFGWS